MKDESAPSGWNMGPMAEALAPLRVRRGYPVREREVLRVAAKLDTCNHKKAIEVARRAILAWAQNRSGWKFPQNAWQGDAFEHLAPGRTTFAARINTKEIEFWALRSEDPDKSVPGRNWATEVAIGYLKGQTPHFSLRLLSASREAEPVFDPAVPGVVRQLARAPGLSIGEVRLSDAPWSVASEQELEQLISFLENPGRRLPVFVASGDERADDPAAPLINVVTLAHATLGLAHVVAVPACFTYGLTDAFGKLRSCYHGAVRVYLPGFDSSADPYAHPLLLGDSVSQAPARTVAKLQEIAAKESLRRLRLGQDVVAFTAVRSAALRNEQENKDLPQSDFEKRLQVALQQIDALQKELDEKHSEVEQMFSMIQEEEDRAIAAERQLRYARERVIQLEAQLAAPDKSPDDNSDLPKSWKEVADWCEKNFVGRLAIAPLARRNMKKARFRNIDLATRCLRWLADECRKIRLNGGRSLANTTVFGGVENAPCGEDTFFFDFQGRRLEADWHVKNGGNTRDPRRCLRIYYGWDDVTQQIVVADMPAHRRTGAT